MSIKTVFDFRFNSGKEEANDQSLKVINILMDLRIIWCMEHVYVHVQAIYTATENVPIPDIPIMAQSVKAFSEAVL